MTDATSEASIRKGTPLHLLIHFLAMMAPPQDTDPLVQDSLFNYRNRKPVDVPWGILYLIFLALTLAGGAYGISNRYMLK